MRKAFTALCSLLLALSTTAAVHYYSATPRADGLAYIAGDVQFPCCITGRVVSAEKPTYVTFIPAVGGRFPATVLTYTGTGTVYAAATRIGEGQPGPQLTPLQTVDLPVSAKVETTVVVQGANVKPDSAFAIRIGAFDPFRVAFDGNGGIVQTNSLPYTPGRTYGVLPSATHVGRQLAGWATAPTNGISVTTNTMVCLGYPTLYAQWRQATSPTNDPAPAVTNYVVTFSANGGYGNMATQTFAYGVAQALSTNLFARTNYTFTGWATAPAGSARYRDGEVVSNLTDKADGVVPLYASWMVSPDQVKTGVVDGVTWRYTVDGGLATIQNIVSTQHVAAIATGYRGRLVIPGTLGGAPVCAIGERAFEGCAGITEVEIPPSVASIGNRAFAGCSGIGPGITIPESVESLGSAVFSGCAALRIVRYYGDCPQVDADLYSGAPRKLVSGVLRVRENWADEEEIEIDDPDDDESDDEDDFGIGDDGTVTVQRLPKRWPEGSDGRGLYWLNGVRICTVALHGNGGMLGDEPRFLYYIPGRPLGELPDAMRGEDETKLVFDGWFTAKIGGLRVDPDWSVTENLSLFAHWKVEDQRDTSGWEENLYDDAEDVQLDRAAEYDGYLYDMEGTNDFQVVGTIAVKRGQGRYNREEESTTAAVTATVQLMGGGKATFKGSVDETGESVLVNARTEDELEISLSQDGLSGSFDGYQISGARNRTKSSRLDDRQFVAAAVGRWGGTWNVALRSTDARGAGAALAEDGISALSVTVGKKGAAKVAGRLSDGTFVSCASQMIFGDGCACLPVFAPFYRKSGGFALLLWFSTDEDAPLTVCGLSGWDARGASLPFEAAFEAIAAGRPNLRSGEAVVSLDGSFAFDGVEVDEDLLPSEVPLTVRNGSWRLPKADRVGFSREDGTYEVATEFGNPAALKLGCASRTGVFKGGFTVFGVAEDGRARRVKASVYGVVVGEAGYGSALIRNVGSAPVSVSVE